MYGELKFDDRNYTVETIEIEGETLRYRAFEGISYAEHPADPGMQVMNIYVPERYYEKEASGPYDLHSAPIFFPNSAGGYMPGPVQRPGISHGRINAIFRALQHGYVVASPGIRGRRMKNAEGKNIGAAPAAVCDLKAAVRYLRHNADTIPGNTERIISNGTSAGGALSALLGAGGNHPDYEAFLKDMGAADERDDIFAASCYCPITNLEHADMAYEWEFADEKEYHRMRFAPAGAEGEKPRMIPETGTMSGEQQELSAKLKAMFPEYVNSLRLTDEHGRLIAVEDDGSGSLWSGISEYICRSAQKELDRGGDLSGYKWLQIEHEKVTGIDIRAYVAYRTRMKTTPAFDNVAMGTPENELFGTEDIDERHFTDFSEKNSKVSGKMADALQIKMMNPMNYIADDCCTTAKFYRIRHGAADRDTSLAVPYLLAAGLRNHGTETDLAYPWGIPHAGDYDLEELFAWIDRICMRQNEADEKASRR